MYIVEKIIYVVCIQKYDTIMTCHFTWVVLFAPVFFCVLSQPQLKPVHYTPCHHITEFSGKSDDIIYYLGQ